MHGRRRVTLPLNAALSSGLRMSQRASRSSRAFLEYKNIIRYEKDDSHRKSCKSRLFNESCIGAMFARDPEL
jgi:hypothetical protein